MNSDLPLRPRSLDGEVDFPHKEDLLAVLKRGASLRRDERLISAESHFGVYSIRLNIAHDSGITKEYEASAEQAAEDIKWFLANLERDLNAVTRAWFIRSEDGERFILFENEENGTPLGCFHGWARKKGEK